MRDVIVHNILNIACTLVVCQLAPNWGELMYTCGLPLLTPRCGDLMYTCGLPLLTPKGGEWLMYTCGLPLLTPKCGELLLRLRLLTSC